MLAVASWVGDSVAWLTETMQALAEEQTIFFVPKGPFWTLKVALTLPELVEVTDLRPFRLQSPAWVALPFFAHSMTTSASLGEKPFAFTLTVSPEWSPLDGETVIDWVSLEEEEEVVVVVVVVFFDEEGELLQAASSTPARAIARTPVNSRGLCVFTGWEVSDRSSFLRPLLVVSGPAC